MTFRGIGYNVAHDSVPYDKVILDMKNSGSACHLIMTDSGVGVPNTTNIETVWRYHNDLYPVYGNDLTLIWRLYSKKEGDWSLFDPQVYTTVVNHRNLPPSVIVDSLSNEPSLNGLTYSTNEQYVRHEMITYDTFEKAGVRYAVGAFSTGTPHEELIKRGVYDPFIRNAQQISMHLYNPFPFEAGETHSWDLLKKNVDNRELIRNIYFNKKQWDKNYKGWFAGRLRWWEERANVLGVKMPEVYVTEALLDIISLIPKDIMNEWKANFGIDDYYRNPYGILSWFNYFKWLFPDLTIEQVVSMMLTHYRNGVVNQEYVKGITLFGYNRNWDKPQGHNWENDSLKGFRDKHLKTVNSELRDKVYVQEELDTKYDLIWSRQLTNVRTEPLIEPDNIAFVLTDKKESVTIIDKEHKVSGNSYVWIKFKRHQDGKIYYVAKTSNLRFIDSQDELSEKTYVIDIFDGTEVITKSDLQELVELLESLKEFVEDIDDSDDEDLVDTFMNFIELRREASEVNKNMTVTFLENIIKKVRYAFGNSY